MRKTKYEVPGPTLSGVCGEFGGYEGRYSFRGLAEESSAGPLDGD